MVIDMSEHKPKKASKTNATVQLDFLPPVAPYPPELDSATEPMVVALEEDLNRPGSKVPKVYVRVDCILNRPALDMPKRYSEAAWERQMASFRRRIDDPVDVRSVPGGYMLAEGRHRVLAAQLLNRAYIKADIDATGTAASSAVRKFEGNNLRAEDRPYDLAVTYQEMMQPPPGAGLNQAQVAEVVGVSQATVSRRLRLVHPNMPVELAVLAGRELDERALEPVFEVIDDAELVAAGAKAVLAAVKAGDAPRGAFYLLRLLADAWHEGKLAIAQDSACFTMDVREDDEFRKAAKGFGAFTVKCADAHDPRRVEKYAFYRRVEAAVAKAQEVSDRLEALRREAEAKLAAKAAKAGKKVKTLPDGSKAVVEAPKKRSLQERVPEQRTRVQLDLMARHIPAQIAFPDDLVAEALDRFVAHTGALLSNADHDAACRALGLPLPEHREGRHDNFHFRRGDFLARWKKDPVDGYKLVAVALFYQARDLHKQLMDGSGQYGAKEVKEPRLPVWLTGKTFEEATELAKQAIKDRDAGFKPVLDGAACDHCDDAATLRKGGVNVCRSNVWRDVDTKTLATRRLRRAEEAKEAAQAKTADAVPTPAEGPAPEATVEAAPAEPVKGKGRKAR